MLTDDHRNLTITKAAQAFAFYGESGGGVAAGGGVGGGAGFLIVQVQLGGDAWVRR